MTDDDYKARMDGTTLWREPDVAPLDGTYDLYPNKRFRPAGDTDGIKGMMNADGTIKVEPAKVDRVLPDREPATFPTADEWDAYAEAERMKHPEAVITESVASILGKMTPAGISKQEKTMHEPKTTQDYIRESANARRVAKAAQLNTARTKGTFHWWYMPLREVGDGLYWKCLGKLHRIGLPPRMGAAYRKWKAS